MTPETSPSSRNRTWSSTRRALRAGAPLVAAAIAFSCTAYAPALDMDDDSPVTTLVTNTRPSSGSSQTVSLSADRTVLFQGFRTGPHPRGYEPA